VGLSCEILKKIRKREKFEVFIFYHKSRRKRRNKKLLAMISYIKETMFVQDIDSESYFYSFKKEFKDLIDFRWLWCLEPGRKLYLEKQFYYNYKFLNLDDASALQKWLNEHITKD
jgi:hypothetical protein